MQTLSPTEKRLIVAALYAVTPTGGGSPQYHLACKLAHELGVDISTDEFFPLVGALQSTAHDEMREGLGLDDA